jgi:hypothetical protein
MECRAGTRTDAQDAHPDTSGRKNDGGKDPTGGDSERETVTKTTGWYSY